MTIRSRWVKSSGLSKPYRHQCIKSPLAQIKIWYQMGAQLSDPKPDYVPVVIMHLHFLTDTVYPKKYAHGFVVLCFVVVMQSFIMNSHEAFIHIHQGCFAGTGAIVRLPQCQWRKPDGYGKISPYITTTKHSKAKNVCIFLGIYCMSWKSVIIDKCYGNLMKWAFLMSCSINYSTLGIFVPSHSCQIRVLLSTTRINGVVGNFCCFATIFWTSTCWLFSNQQPKAAFLEDKSHHVSYEKIVPLGFDFSKYIRVQLYQILVNFHYFSVSSSTILLLFIFQ